MSTKPTLAYSNDEPFLVGNWVPLPVSKIDVDIQVRSIHYAPFQRAFVDLYRELPVEQTYNQTILFKLLGETILDHILLDWRGFEWPYTVEHARSLLVDAPDVAFVRDVLKASMKVKCLSGKSGCHDGCLIQLMLMPLTQPAA